MRRCHVCDDVDDVNSYSTNEVAVNWNAPLAWVASWAADQGSVGELVGDLSEGSRLARRMGTDTGSTR